MTTVSECKKCGSKLTGSKFCPDCGAKIVQPSQKPAKAAKVSQRTAWSPKRVAWIWGISIGLVAIVAIGTSIVVPSIQDDQRREQARVSAIEAAQDRMQLRADAATAIERANDALANTGSVGGVDDARATVAIAISELQAAVGASDYEKIKSQTSSLRTVTSTLVAKDKAAVKAVADAAAAAAAAAAAEAKAAAAAQWTFSGWNPDCIRTSKTFCKLFFNLTNNTSYDLNVGTSGQVVINGRTYSLEVQHCYVPATEEVIQLDCEGGIAPGSALWVRTLATDLPMFETLTFTRVTIGDRFRANLSFNWG